MNLIKDKLYRIKRGLLKKLIEIKVLLTPSGPEKRYDFNNAKQYWRNVPKAKGSNPWDTEKLKSISDEELILQFNGEQKKARDKYERKLGFQRAFESIIDIENPLVMDYGSGIGFYGFEILNHFPNALVTFVDINQNNLDIIARIGKLLALEDRINIFQVKDARAKDIYFTNKFNLIISMGVLHHTPYAVDIIHHLTQFINNNGIFLVMLYNQYYKKRLSLKKGYRLNNSTFGALTDPMVDGLQNPYSEGYDDNKAIDLFGNNYEMISKDYPTSDYNIYRFIKTDH